MINEDRLKELEEYFWSETNDEESQEWRNDLTEEEEKLIDEWDNQYSKGFNKLCNEIIKHNKD